MIAALRTKFLLGLLGFGTVVGGSAFLGSRAFAEEKEKEFAADKGADTVDVSSFPAEIKNSYQTFASKCSKCHTLARPINTDMRVKGWKRYVKRMMNKPDSGLSPAQGKTVFKFLKFYQNDKDSKSGKLAKPADDGEDSEDGEP